MNNLVFLHNLSFETHLEDDCLLVLVSANQIIDPEAIVTFVSEGVASLKISNLKIIRIFAHEDGKNFPSWIKEISLQTPSIALKPLKKINENNLRLSWLITSLPLGLAALGGLYWLMEIYFWKNTSNLPLFNPSLIRQDLGRTILAQALQKGKEASAQGKIAQTEAQWREIEFQWQQAIELLKSIPSNSSEYARVQSKIQEYEKNLLHAQKQPEYLRWAKTEATEAVKLGKVAQSQTEWKMVADHWQKAINRLQQIKVGHPDYVEAQEKIEEYQEYYLKIEDKIAIDGMKLMKTITGNISPKSIIYSGNGLFFAQNMMYRHTITVYDRNYNLIKTIADQVKLADYGYEAYPGTYQGAPVEGAFSHNGEYLWVSNYQMYGKEFQNPGSDRCEISSTYDPSFVYRLNTSTFTMDQVIKVGSVPKYVATSPDDRLVLTSNWCSGDISIINTEKNQEVKRIFVGAYPRGIAIDKNSEKAYIAVMGSRDLAIINLKDYSLNWIKNVGLSPRHLILEPDDQHLYISLNGEGQIARFNLKTQDLVKIKTGNAPRSMVLSKTGKYLYVVNYNSHTVSKVRTSDLKIVQTVKTAPHPIGITYDPEKEEVWVASYSGSILVFQDQE